MKKGHFLLLGSPTPHHKEMTPMELKIIGSVLKSPKPNGFLPLSRRTLKIKRPLQPSVRYRSHLAIWPDTAGPHRTQMACLYYARRSYFGPIMLIFII